MTDYRKAIDEIRKTMEALRVPDTKTPFRMEMGSSAYARLREILDHGADPGLPNTWGSAPRSMLLLTGLPIYVKEGWPPNMWAVLNCDGKALQAGILNTPTKEKTDAPD